MSFIKRIFLFILHCGLILFLVVVARETWSSYQEEKLTDRFAREGTPVSVRVGAESQVKKNWKDYLSNNRYFTFTYQEKTYTVHYFLDSGWVGTGDLIHLLYLPALDAFRQPGNFVRRGTGYKKSPLVSWIVVGTFSLANRSLFITVLLSVVIVVFSLSAMARLTGISLFDKLANVIVIVAAYSSAIFFTWDLWMNYRYYNAVKAQGSTLTLPVITTDAYTYGTPRYSNSVYEAHYYSATVEFGSESRMIAINESDYDHLKPRDALAVWYNRDMDDMVSAAYRVEKYKWFFPVMIWILGAFYTWKKWPWRKPDTGLARESQG